MIRSPSDGPVVGFLYEYWRPHAPTFLVGLCATVLGRLPELLPALLFGVALDALFTDTAQYSLPLVPDAWIPASTSGQFGLTIGLLCCAYASTAALDWLSTRAYNKVRFRIVHDVRVDVYESLQHAPMAFFDDRQTGDLMSVLNRDVGRVQSFVKDGVRSVARFLAFTVALFCYLLLINWQLALTLVLVPIVAVAITIWFSKRIERRHERVRERLGALHARLQTNFDAIAVVKAYAREPFERERLRDSSADVMRARWDLIRLRATVRPVLSILVGAATATVFFAGGVWIIDGPPAVYSGSLTVGELFTIMVYVGSLTGPVRGTLAIGDTYQESRAAVGRIQEVTDAARERVDRAGTVAVDAPRGDVTATDLTFTYPGAAEPALSGVSFEASPGETIGIVGSSGAGKSTLLALLMRFYEADDGELRIDGVGVTDWPVEDLRAAIGYVSQEPVLFEASVRENVAYGDDDPSEEALTAALEQAKADEFVENLPDGADTEVGERGAQLSGGQRQRIAIARALYGDPPILVLDEATSHVDSETEAYIKRQLRTVARDRTTFVVAHRLSSVRDADRVYVLDDGRIVEQGTHDELVDRDGRYARLWRAQTAGIGIQADSATVGADPAAGGGSR